MADETQETPTVELGRVDQEIQDLRERVEVLELKITQLQQQQPGDPKAENAAMAEETQG
jgi:4-alpha-glucanotransferase